MSIFRRAKQVMNSVGAILKISGRLVLQNREQMVPTLHRVRTYAEPAWRKIMRAAIVLLGFSIFFGMEYVLARGVIGWEKNWFLVLIVGVAVLAVLIAAKNSTAMMALWLVLVPWTWHFPLRSAKYYLQFDLLTLTILTLVVVPKFLVQRRRLARFNVAEWLLILSVLYCNVWSIVKFGIAENESIRSVAWQLLLVPGVIYFLTKIAIESKRQIKLLVGAIILIGILWTISGFYEHYTGYQWHSALTGDIVPLQWTDIGLGRAVGPSDSQVAPGTVLCAGLLVLLHFIRYVKRVWLRFCYYAVVACMMMAVFFTYTRTSYAGFALALVIAFLISKGRRIQYGVVVGILAVVAMIMIPVMMTNDEFNYRMTSDRNYYQRKAMLATGMNIVRDYFWFGAGEKVRDQVFLQKYVSSRLHPRLGKAKLLEYPESDYLIVLAEHGIFGFLFHFSAIFAFVYVAFQMRHKMPLDDVLGSNLASLSVAYAFVVLIAMTLTQLQAQPYLYYLMYVLFAMVVRAKELHDQEKQTLPGLSGAAYEHTSLPI
jgi:hypothetical protein